MIRQAFREESMTFTWVFEWKSPHSPRMKKKAGQLKSKIKGMLIIFYHIEGLFKNNLSWQAKQSLSNATHPTHLTWPHVTFLFSAILAQLR
jgi:hypothetical protein